MRSDATRGLLEAHFDAFNRHDATALYAGMAEDIVWSTGTDTFRGVFFELREGLLRSVRVYREGTAEVPTD